MNVTRGFLVTGPLYLILGIVIGFYMSATQDHTLTPAHAHINLLGFAVMMIFGLFYAVFPIAADTRLARANFWLHQVGTAILVVMLVLLFTGRIEEAQMFPLAPLAIVAVLVGAICFAINAFRHAR
jgi:heme/copper-type cytochrome/quinol oxidase subunit 1